MRQAAETVLTRLQADMRSQLTVAITDDATVRRLNLKYRQLDSATDVLSFPAGQMPIHCDVGEVYLGDIIIAYPYAHSAATRCNVKTENTLCLLLVHGLLHLLGYDHDTDAAKQKMWEEQATVLSAMGIDPAIVCRYGSC